MDATLDRARRLLDRAANVAVLTGAGVSAESGVPTFRGPEGLWRDFRPEDLATPQAFARDPKLVWEWYDWRRQRIAEAQPNAAHHALARLEETKRDFTLATQNVDGLHRLAGSRRLLELHGDIWTLRCSRCAREAADRRAPLPELPPRCACGALLRPGVVWFGESLPAAALEEAFRAARASEVTLVVGTSAVVYPAAGMAHAALAAGRALVEINPEETELTALATVFLRGKAARLLPALVG